MPKISAVALPDHLAEHQLKGCVAVVIDVLRATTTVAQALEHGAGRVLPVAWIDAARMIAHQRAGSVLCGERGGIRPEGFVLGNSPSEYHKSTIAGSDLVLTTTNGTRALHMCDAADEILTGSITNLDALCAYLATHDQDVVLVCSGTDRRVSLEDCLCAGLITQALEQSHSVDDAAHLMRHAAGGAIEACGGLQEAVASSFHAKRLYDLGFGADVVFASQRSITQTLPRFDALTGEIIPVEQNERSVG